MIELVYETHSLTTDNEAGIATGWIPGLLSERGRAAAQALGERRRDDGIEVVFTSDLRRAVETAEIAFAGSGLPVRQDPRLRECNYGELNGRPVAEIDAQRLRRVETPFPGGESYHDVVERTRSFLADLARDEPSRVLVIAHSANRWAIEHLLEGRAVEELVAAPFAWQEGWVYRLDGSRFAQG
ncbi:MAG: histidine phosphatase family protein [Actinobacteria bacterium]|nr:MAG: histidine phosphatase family protein [Actinomycetota bacterium]